MKFSQEELLDFCNSSTTIHKAESIASAYKFCQNVAESHYENFPVASVLLPKQQRKHIYAIYAFSRTADDIADEILDVSSEERIQNLENYLNILRDKSIYNELSNPIFLALRNTVKELQLPLTPFEKLIKAFQMDSDFTHANNWNDLLHYCEHSANPVGELVLRVFQIHNNTTSPLSDSVCTGLQLVNFWQDFSVDIEKNRMFIPQEILDKYKISKKDFMEKNISDNFSDLLNEIYDYSESFFIIGKKLIKHLKPLRLRFEIALTIEGGLEILRQTRKLGTRIVFERPKISKGRIFPILLKSILKHRVIF